MKGLWTVWRGDAAQAFPTAEWTYVEKDAVAQFRSDVGVIVQIPWAQIQSLTFTPDVAS